MVALEGDIPAPRPSHSDIHSAAQLVCPWSLCVLSVGGVGSGDPSLMAEALLISI